MPKVVLPVVSGHQKNPELSDQIAQSQAAQRLGAATHHMRVIPTLSYAKKIRAIRVICGQHPCNPWTI